MRSWLTDWISVVCAVPPFGNLYEMDVYVSDALAENIEIAFNEGERSGWIEVEA
jgi:prolyl-tRNA editing enzyme YbaK/EbsC (Cys-tRNA(Pro) deacylase)